MKKLMVITSLALISCGGQFYYKSIDGEKFSIPKDYNDHMETLRQLKELDIDYAVTTGKMTELQGNLAKLEYENDLNLWTISQQTRSEMYKIGELTPDNDTFGNAYNSKKK